MTNAEVEQWIDACNHEPARQVLRDYLALRARSSPDLSGGGEAARIIACHLPLPDTPDTVCLPITMTAGDLRTVYTALSPSREGVEPEAGAVGAADTQVGKAVYERIEALVSRNPTPDSSEWAELDYLSHLAESVEEVGGFDGPLAPIYSHPNLAWTWDRAVNLGCQTDEPTLRQMVEHYYRSHSMPDPILWTSKYIEAHPTPADDRLAVAVEALEIVRDGMEASGGWDGDEDVFSAVVEALALLTKSGEAEG